MSEYLAGQGRIKRRAIGGDGRIAGISPGITTIDGVPAPCDVVLMLRSEKRVIGRALSKPQGTYSFDHLDESREFTVLGLDINRVHNAVAADRITPAPMPAPDPPVAQFTPPVLDWPVQIAYVSDTQYALATSTSVTIPANAQVGDLLVAVIFRRQAMSPPSGWALFASISAAYSIETTQWTEIYIRTAESGDAGQVVTFTQSASDRIARILLVCRSDGGTPTIADSATAAISGTGESDQQHAVVAASANGQLGIATASFVLPSTRIASTDRWWQRTTPSDSDNRLFVATRRLNAAETTAGLIKRPNYSGSTDGIGKISLVLAAPA
jgi:hypothetical protein